MEETDLEAIGITETEHRTKLLKAAAALPKLEPIGRILTKKITNLDHL